VKSLLLRFSEELGLEEIAGVMATPDFLPSSRASTAAWPR